LNKQERVEKPALSFIKGMPIYLYRNDGSEETREVFQKMNDEHIYLGKEGNELGWRRVYTVPQASFDTKVDPNDPKSFVERTASKKGTYGDMQDYSKELSHKRAEQHDGVDPVKEDFFKRYSAERKGAKHPEEQRKAINDGGMTVEWD